MLVHRVAVVTLAATFALIIAGALVTSRDAGLAVPDWPLAYGELNPPRWYQIENVRTEHGHRTPTRKLCRLQNKVGCKRAMND